jgi:hypothetical protein
MGFITKLQKREQNRETCSDQGYNCCSCGDRENGCGCRYCSTCNYCEACWNDDEDNCVMLG